MNAVSERGERASDRDDRDRYIAKKTIRMLNNNNDDDDEGDEAGLAFFDRAPIPMGSFLFAPIYIGAHDGESRVWITAQYCACIIFPPAITRLIFI